ncbi:MAG TPA: HAD-IC family P-type ATPase [Candidatus Paceibacterota bacterium]|nr:HAD-IC family P-type ATPase [Candidatus Paceibacterota bacterium]
MSRALTHPERSHPDAPGGSVGTAVHPRGLSEIGAKRILTQTGPNVLSAKKKSGFLKFLHWFLSPIPLMLIAAAVLSYASGKQADAALIFTLLLANYGIQVWHEHKANQAVEKLEEHLALYARVMRDGVWKRIPAAEVVPGDRIALRVGSSIPADARLENVTNFSVNESMLTGESLPKEKGAGDTVYSASFVATGSGEATVTATGNRTYFGAAVKTLELAKKRSALEEDIVSISKLLAVLALVAIAILTAVLYFGGGSFTDLASLDISLLIAGIPVALPTVMSLIISAGVLELAKGGAVVRRLSALEDLANVNLLLSDKTGTLTENKIHVSSVVTFGPWKEDEALMLAASATDAAEVNPLETAIREAAAAKHLALLLQTRLIPGDSERKRTTTIVERDGSPWTVTFGAPPTVARLCRFDTATSAAFADAVDAAADRGDRALLAAVAKHSREERSMEPVALILLSDTLRADASATVKEMNAQGIGVKMLTGDGLPIARDVAHTLGLSGTIYRRSIFDNPEELAAELPSAAGFAEVMPKDKYTAVEAAKKIARVAVTGDGANDIPSVSDADVGIAVAKSVDALRETADIVLLSNGLAIIATAIRQARMVFMRLYHYSLYRISESARLIMTILIIGVVVGNYPLTPIQVLLLAFLNDVPIISIAFDRVSIPKAPAAINVKQRAVLSLLYGLVGIANSIATLYLTYYYLHLPWPWIQTLFFLQLVVSGHMLIYVAHTEEPWFRFFPSWQVIAAVTATQLLATLWAAYGFFTAPVPLWIIAFVWIWSFFWMQVTESFKMLSYVLVGRIGGTGGRQPAATLARAA